MGLAYLLGRGSAKLLDLRVNVPLVLAPSIIPDADILVPFMTHRGVTHSIIVTLIVFIPMLALWRKKAVPYLLP
jgi:membrane-bound metal-dependent hydrolase YbcI (DUF457 family)